MSKPSRAIMTPATGRLLVIGSAVAWSTAGIFTKGVGADVWVVLFWRGLIAAVLMVAYLSWRGGDSHPRAWWRLGWPGWTAAAVGRTAMVCSIAAFKNTDVANVAVIYATAPFAAAAIARGFGCASAQLLQRSLPQCCV